MLTSLVKTYTKVAWLPEGSYLHLIQSNKLPDISLITSVHILCFEGDRLLFVNHCQRGWDIPGGHIEKNESLEQALARELLEEAAVTAANLVPCAYFHIQINGPKPKTYKYPYPESFICVFLGNLRELLNFDRKFETLERRFFEPSKIRELEWYRGHKEIYELALDVHSS